VKKLAGSTAIVTGASRGIGVHIARALAGKGAKVALVARSVPQLDQQRRDLAATGATVLAVAADVTIPSERARVLQETEEQLGPVDILVNNAGIELMSHYDELPADEIARLIDVNLIAPMLLTRAVIPGMIDRGRGHIVNMASMAGKCGAPFAAPYSASKFGLVGFTHALRAEYRGAPVGFSVVCPGFVTDDGMYADFAQALDIEAPRLVGTTSPAKVAAAVLEAIQKNRPDIIVNDMPMRPLFALLAAFPRLHSVVMQATGTTGMMGRVADARRSQPAPVVIDLDEREEHRART
jgi:short-subunit dehydrogenase